MFFSVDQYEKIESPADKEVRQTGLGEQMQGNDIINEVEEQYPSTSSRNKATYREQSKSKEPSTSEHVTSRGAVEESLPTVHRPASRLSAGDSSVLKQSK